MTHMKVAFGLRMHRETILRDCLRWLPLDHLMVEAHKMLEEEEDK